MKLKGLHFVDVAAIQEAITDELMKVQKEEFLAAFQKLYNHTKACIYANGAYFEFKKKVMSSSCVFDLKKKSVLKLSDRTVYPPLLKHGYWFLYLKVITIKFHIWHKNPHCVQFQD